MSLPIWKGIIRPDFIGCVNIHGTCVTANNSTTNNIVFLFCFRFENSILLQLLILYHNASDEKGKNILHL